MLKIFGNNWKTATFLLKKCGSCVFGDCLSSQVALQPRMFSYKYTQFKQVNDTSNQTIITFMYM